MSTETSDMRIAMLVGNNFSGRSAMLRKYTGYAADEPDGFSSIVPSSPKRHYLGPDVANFFSGVALDVDHELEIHGGRHWREVRGITEILNTLRFAALMNQNPYLLSGGEQAVLAVASSLAGQPSELALDCSLESLNPLTREALLQVLRERCDWCECIVIADNRLADYASRWPTWNHHDHPLSPTSMEDSKIMAAYYIPYAVDPVRVSLKSLHFRYPNGEDLLRGIDLQLEPGNIYLLKGPNGAGKTTLSKILAGILEPNRASIRINEGKPLTCLAPGAIFAYHFQNPDLQLFEVSVGNEVRSAAPLAISDSELQHLLRALGLAHEAKTHPFDLPFTLRKRLALAATFSMQRPWLILDEPSLGQDDENVDELLHIIRKQVDAGTGAVIITHSQSLTRKLSAETIHLRDGVVQLEQRRTIGGDH